MMHKDWIAPHRTALLLVDMQVDFASPDGAMAKAGHDVTTVQAALEKASLLAVAARAAGVPCLFARLVTRDSDETDLLREWKKRRGTEDDAPLCHEGTRGAEFVGPKPLPDEAVFSKSRYDAFAGTNLDAHLRGLKRDTLVIAGLTTECCVESTARDAFERDYHVFVARDAVAAYTPDLHRAALKALELNCAILADCAEIAAAWKK
ncbi:MAG TPA: cysteine hydrolase [Rhizomicrobium sp.]|jgi:ureidoacrylate peracid hydrolase|nr:cysteine hydrolase [Rhizomicrobium sp.]